MKNSTKILIGVGAIAAIAIAYRFYSKKKKTEDAPIGGVKPIKPSPATETILPTPMIKPSKPLVVDMEEVAILAPTNTELPISLDKPMVRPLFPVDPYTGGYKDNAPLTIYKPVRETDMFTEIV